MESGQFDNVHLITKQQHHRRASFCGCLFLKQRRRLSQFFRFVFNFRKNLLKECYVITRRKDSFYSSINIMTEEFNWKHNSFVTDCQISVTALLRAATLAGQEKQKEKKWNRTRSWPKTVINWSGSRDQGKSESKHPQDCYKSEIIEKMLRTNSSTTPLIGCLLRAAAITCALKTFWRDFSMIESDIGSEL